MTDRAVLDPVAMADLARRRAAQAAQRRLEVADRIDEIDRGLFSDGRMHAAYIAALAAERHARDVHRRTALTYDWAAAICDRAALTAARFGLAERSALHREAAKRQRRRAATTRDAWEAEPRRAPGARPP